MPPLLPDGPVDTLGHLDALHRIPERIAAAGSSGVGETRSPGDVIVVGGTGEAAPIAAAVVALVARAHPEATVVATDGPLPAGGIDLDRLADHHGAPTSVDRRAAASALLVTGCLAAGVAVDVDAALGAARARLDGATDPAAPPVRLARRVDRSIPVFHGADALGAAVARRWRDEVALCAKAPAFDEGGAALREVAIAGWGQHGDLTRQVFAVVDLRHRFEGSAGASMDAMAPLLDEVVVDRHEIVSDAPDPIAAAVDLFVAGAIFAHHLARRLEIDPGPVAAAGTVAPPATSD